MAHPVDPSPPGHPGGASEGVCPITIFFDGKPISAQPGDTVASALYRCGVRIFSRSFKYHRPRGLLCGSGHCPNCLMTVDGIPNVRTCITRVHDGQKVRHQNATPSLENDWLSVSGFFSWLMPVGFYYKTFTHPLVWRGVEPLIRKVAGLGEVSPEPAADAGSESHPEHGSTGAGPAYAHIFWHTEVAVVGGGPAGLLAALQAARSGGRVVLIDDQPELGGHLRFQGKGRHSGEWVMPDGQDLSGLSGPDLARKMAEQVVKEPRIRVLQDSTCFGLYEGRLLGVLQKLAGGQRTANGSPSAGHSQALERLIYLRTQRLVVATGAYEALPLFENNDLPGVMLRSAAQRLAHLHGVQPGKRAVIVSEQADGGPVAADLKVAGVEIEAVIPRRELVSALGRKHIKGIRTTRGDLACDLLVLEGDRVPDAGLIAQAGGSLRWEEGQRAFLPGEMPPFVTVVGEAAGIQPNPEAPLPGPCSKKTFVCVCEDVTVKDLCDAVQEGFDHIQTLKRYSTVTMGPCQGRMCQLSSIAVCARQTGRAMEQTGTTTSRPPTLPISLGSLAGPRHHPVRRTPLHPCHEALGCTWMDMGDWKRPHHYPAPAAEPGASGHGATPAHTSTSHSHHLPTFVEAEYRAVRERVGIIDVSTLGRLDVRGKDAPKLLDKVYTNRLSDMKLGRVRHAALCDEAGILLDDGTVSRLAEDHYFITTSTGNIEFVQQWLEWWMAGAGWCVHVTNVTGGLAAVNVAGPKARETLAGLTGTSLETAAFPYMNCRQADVGGVPCLMLRIGFVGETGWELHFPAEYGEYLWDLVMKEGQPFGIGAFGVETQRLLRLEKKHVIVGVDTDATSNPMDADMAWVAKLDKEDFIGKAAILRFQARLATGQSERLVGFVMEDDSVPLDGSAVVHGGRPAGRVTSCRFSPSIGRGIGLAWIPSALAHAGRHFSIHVNGQLGQARVTFQPFYDPEGKRLRM
ncbi:MAG: (2Fe-2S)-binding protein [Planctomycetes bacterium]|nr:(2Fe-2S)-binding protein [Planctomycetota bacterium]